MQHASLMLPLPDKNFEGLP